MWPFTKKEKQLPMRERLRVGDRVLVCDFMSYLPCLAMIGPPEPVGRIQEVVCAEKAGLSFMEKGGSWISYERLVEILPSKEDAS